ncbi:MAG: HEAT repeat domain-containing protein [Deltaproteobacteria bacterium]|nr:HEAT repeat domain-containing protein [Deltaproteobacteria bacterium]
MAYSDPKHLSLGEVEGLSGLAPDERVRRIYALVERLNAGASGAEVEVAMAAMAAAEGEISVRDAWVSYAAASRSESFLPVLAKWIADNSWNKRRRVLYALMEIRARAVNEILLEIIAHDGERVLRSLALRNLVRRGSLGLWEPVDLTGITKDEDWYGPTRREYIELLKMKKARS